MSFLTTATVQAWWKAHGTKILGFFTGLVGAAGELVTYIQQLDAKHAALWGLVVGLGAFVVKRGFFNSSQQPLP